MLLAEALANNHNLSGEAFNFSNELQITVLELVERILKLMNSNLKPDIRDNVRNEIRHQYLSAEKARKILNWEPTFSLNEGLVRTIDWYRMFIGEQDE